MGRHLLVITAGTVATGVGREFLRQVKAHAMSDLEVKVRYMDTSYLPDTYPDIQVGEWFHLKVDASHMNFTQRKLDENRRLEKLLYPGLLLETDGAGGGSIRYNGAGSIEVARDDIKTRIKSGMDDLARTGDRQTSIAVALVVSAVGATGSGSLEHLIKILVDEIDQRARIKLWRALQKKRIEYPSAYIRTIVADEFYLIRSRCRLPLAFLTDDDEKIYLENVVLDQSKEISDLAIRSEQEKIAGVIWRDMLNGQRGGKNLNRPFCTVSSMVANLRGARHSFVHPRGCRKPSVGRKKRNLALLSTKDKRKYKSRLILSKCGSDHYSSVDLIHPRLDSRCSFVATERCEMIT